MQFSAARQRRSQAGEAKKFRARDLLRSIAEATWQCGDPGIQYDTTINDWHTCPGTARINGSNPCSEYMFLDDTACNLASLNLALFYTADGQFELENFRHAVRLWTIVLEISVLMAAFPSKEIARLSYEYRTLGLGFAYQPTRSISLSCAISVTVQNASQSAQSADLASSYRSPTTSCAKCAAGVSR